MARMRIKANPEIEYSAQGIRGVEWNPSMFCYDAFNQAMRCMSYYTVDSIDERTKRNLAIKNALLDRDYKMLFNKRFCKKEMKLVKTAEDMHRYKFCKFSITVVEELAYHDEYFMRMMMLLKFNFYREYDRYDHTKFKSIMDYMVCFRIINRHVETCYDEFFDRLEFLDMASSIYASIFPKTINEITDRFKAECRKPSNCLIETPLKVLRILNQSINAWLTARDKKNQFTAKLKEMQSSFQKSSDRMSQAIKRITQ